MTPTAVPISPTPFHLPQARFTLPYESAPKDPSLRSRLRANWPGRPVYMANFNASWAEQPANPGG